MVVGRDALTAVSIPRTAMPKPHPARVAVPSVHPPLCPRDPLGGDPWMSLTDMPPVDSIFVNRFSGSARVYMPELVFGTGSK